jgi:hypothetical protein
MLIESAASPNKTSKLAVAILTLLLILIVTIPLFTWVRLGWFLPEPQYTATFYNQILQQELILSLKNLLIGFLILTVAFFLTFFFFFSRIFHFSGLKILLVCSFFGAITTVGITGWDISRSMSYWGFLERATLSYEQKIYKRGRGGGLGIQKEYSITFVNPSNTADGVKSVLVPSLQQSGFIIHPQSTGQKMMDNLNMGQNFVITPQNRNYLSLNFTKPDPKSVVPQSIHFLLGYNRLFSNNTADLVKSGTTEGFIRLFPNN